MTRSGWVCGLILSLAGSAQAATPLTVTVPTTATRLTLDTAAAQLGIPQSTTRSPTGVTVAIFAQPGRSYLLQFNPDGACISDFVLQSVPRGTRPVRDVRLENRCFRP